MFAARENDLESARVLVKAGADINAQSADGKDALSLAFFDGSYDVAEFLIDSHANVNQKDAQRFTPSVLGCRPAQHGDRTQFPVDGDPGPASRLSRSCWMREQIRTL